ncbi:EcsC family protein [Thermoflavimicrobium daqui]|uniref:EcsC family protein n=1 Tax=Thermoflavimicrobium daqui TaxID=2137476 RepID=UPI00269C5ACF
MIKLLPEKALQLHHELQKIEEWEQEQKDLWFWEKLGRIPFAILDKITPQLIHNLIGKFLDELGSYIQTGGQYLIHEKNVYTQLAKAVNVPVSDLTLQDIASLPISLMNQVSEQLKKSHIDIATVQGATTGIGGVFTLAIDIPALLGLSLKVLQEMAMVHGYPPHEKKERIFIVKCLQFSSADFVGKQSILKDLSSFDEPNMEREVISQIHGWREVFENYRDNYGWKKLFQMIPIIGILFGAWINRSTIEEVAAAGQMLYRKRRILQRLSTIEGY